MKNNYYVVFTGRVRGIFDDWEETKSYVEGYHNPEYLGFNTKKEAEEALLLGYEDSKRLKAERNQRRNQNDYNDGFESIW